jgi:putative nucleotidyltransferase with HDIG domain
MVKSPDDLVSGSERLSTVPLVFAKLNEAINSPRSSVGYISTIISQDASLTARLLRIVNSAFYGFPRKVDTISRAVLIVGTQQLRDLTLATSVIKMFKKIPDKYVTMESFWRHSVTCGVAARALAGLCRESNIERFFVAGILHDIGKLIIYDRLPDKSEQVLVRAYSNNELVYKVEQDIIGFDHAAVGGALVKAWRLPSNLEEMITNHHAPTLANRNVRETTIVHMADAITHAMQIGNSGEAFMPPVNEDAWKSLELSIDVLPQVFDVVERQSQDVFTQFLAD